MGHSYKGRRNPFNPVATPPLPAGPTIISYAANVTTIIYALPDPPQWGLYQLPNVIVGAEEDIEDGSSRTLISPQFSGDQIVVIGLSADGSSWVTQSSPVFTVP
jgi:hypothetical protein